MGTMVLYLVFVDQMFLSDRCAMQPNPWIYLDLLLCDVESDLIESFSDPRPGYGELGSTRVDDCGRIKSRCTVCRFGLSVFFFRVWFIVDLVFFFQQRDDVGFLSSTEG
ncbi:hypothetical protein CDL12_21840 [Handroanthus impetiginosus]|uniref:Uncharacterized protein n=1 Tax=Handroanthus impetiginosus TaxID=429701 RepID=A0A2G9GK02_9LAMI|nr:hypothetical protein CDL12_21840 [Handroanthus impetiginosus]